MAHWRLVIGDLLDQDDVDAIVNTWNRNLFPWWLLLPQGVSGAIKRRAGLAPFRALSRLGMLPLGSATLTEAGELPFKGIIHVVGINLLWRSSPDAIERSVSSALALAKAQGWTSIAMPLIGAGSGGFSPETAEALMIKAIETNESPVDVVLVKYSPASRA